VTLEFPIFVTRTPASIVSGNASDRWKRHIVSTTMPTTGLSPGRRSPWSVRWRFTAVSKYA